MFFTLFSHLILLCVFLFGSTFSCFAVFEKSHEHYDSHIHTEEDHTEKHTHEEAPDNCCPDDGHAKQVDIKE